MSDDDLVVCEQCKWARENGKFALAAKCQTCGGKGFRRKDDDFICNMCTEVMQPRGYGLINAKVSGGYYSDYLWDLTQYQFSMCEKCLRDIFNRFKIPPKIHAMSMDGELAGEESYEQDRKAHERRLWKKSGGNLVKFHQGLCNYEENCPNKAQFRQCISEQLMEKSYCESHSQHENYGNSFYLPETELIGIAHDVKNRTLEQKIQVCDVLARYYYRDQVLFDKYLNVHVHELLDIAYDHKVYLSGVWVPNDKKFEHLDGKTLNVQSFPSGTLYWLPEKEMPREYAHKYPDAVRNWMDRNDGDVK